MSKNFKPEEIIGYLNIDGKTVTYLKQGVKRNPHYDKPLEEEDFEDVNTRLWINTYWLMTHKTEDESYNH